MKPIIIDINDLSESAEIYKAAPNKLMVIFIYIMLAFTLIAVGWMSIFSIDEVVKTDGILMKNNDDKYHAELYVSDLDFGKVYLGQNVKFEINSYPASEYGYFHGRIYDISKIPVMGAEEGHAYYQLKVTLDEEGLKDPNGKELPLADGLSCRGNIITGHERIITSLLKKL